MKSLNKSNIKNSNNTNVVHSEPVFQVKRLVNEGKSEEAKKLHRDWVQSRVKQGYDLKPM